MHKDFGSASIQFPMMTSTNNTVWSIRMKVLLRVHEFLEAIEHGSDDQKKNNVEKTLLFQSIRENYIFQVRE